MKTLLCCIGRRENQHIREFVEWYKNLGFTNIVLYDNNYDGEEDFRDAIGDYIDDGYVILKDYRNKRKCQLEAYNSCYNEYKDDYDWFAFFDCDEFLVLTKKKTIDEYLSSILFKNFDMIHLNWMCYGDSDLLECDGRTLNEMFTKPIPYDKHISYDFPENNHIKTMIRGGINIKTLFRDTPHTPYIVLDCCNNRGIRCNSAWPFAKYDFSEAYLKHFSTKTVTDYCEKMKKGFPGQKWDGSRIKELVETRFFRYNSPTKEKIEIVKRELGIDMTYLIQNGEKRKDVQLFMLCYDKEEYGFVDNAVMTPIQCGAANGKDVCKLKDNTGDNISALNYLYVENTGIYWIWKNVKDAVYKGQTQYRRRLEGVDETMDYDNIFRNYDIICAKPYNYPANHAAFIPSDTVLGGYAYSHCKEDLEDLGKIVCTYYPEYSFDWDKYIVNGENLYYSNGFVMKADKYDEYCTFLFDLLQKWAEKHGITRYEDVIRHVAFNMGRNKYIRYPIEHRNVENLTWPEFLYQTRIFGYLSERIFTLWVCHNIPENKRYEVSYVKMEGGMYI